MAVLRKLCAFYLGFVLWISSSAEQISEYGERCLDCKGVTDASQCRKTTECWGYETCFTEKILNSTGSVWYNFGCKTKEECSALDAPLKSRRFDVELRTCQKCCNGSLCNIGLCTDQSDLLPCLGCERVASPQNCNDVVVCSKGQQCYAEKYLEHGLNPVYNFGCAPNLICDAIQSGSSHSRGKRHLEESPRTLTKRSTYLCQRCCNGQGCNADVCDEQLTSTASTTPMETTSESINITTPTPSAYPNVTDVVNVTQTTDNATAESNVTFTTSSVLNITEGYNTTLGSTTTVTFPPPTAMPIPVAKDCWELRSVYNVTSDGSYDLIRPLSEGNVSASCDMTTDGGGWVVFQRRVFGNLSFDKNWKDFQDGFGDLDEAFWWGNENIYEFTQDEPMVMRIDLRDVNGDSMFAEYGNFSLSNSSDYYRLDLGGYRGPAGSIMYFYSSPSETGARHVGVRFTTKDEDHDNWVGNCATYTGGGYWLDECCIVCPNGKYKQINSDLCMGSVMASGQILHCVQFIEMKFRPASAPSFILDEFIDPPA